MDTKHIKYYRPDCVIAPCGIGSSCYIGHLDESTVLKYPLVDDEATRALLVAEAYMYQVLGSHPRILQCFGLGKHGLQLEYAPKGTLKEFLASASRSFRGKITWWRQTVEAIAYAHTKNIMHCNISTANLLLDNDLNIKLCDFQGRALDPLTRVVIQSGDALEASKSYLPRPLGQDDERSDIFALGCTFYEVMTGHEPYPELNAFDDDEEIRRRYECAEFPVTDAILGGDIILKCWTQAYTTCLDCLEDVKALEERCKQSNLPLSE